MERELPPSPETFEYICNKLGPQMLRQGTHVREAVSMNRRVAITVWRLATNPKCRTIAHLFGVANSTTFQIVDEVCAVIVQKLFR